MPPGPSSVRGHRYFPRVTVKVPTVKPKHGDSKGKQIALEETSRPIQNGHDLAPAKPVEEDEIIPTRRYDSRNRKSTSKSDRVTAEPATGSRYKLRTRKFVDYADLPPLKETKRPRKLRRPRKTTSVSSSAASPPPPPKRTKQAPSRSRASSTSTVTSFISHFTSSSSASPSAQKTTKPSPLQPRDSSDSTTSSFISNFTSSSSSSSPSRTSSSFLAKLRARFANITEIPDSQDSDMEHFSLDVSNPSAPSQLSRFHGITEIPDSQEEMEEWTF